MLEGLRVGEWFSLSHDNGRGGSTMGPVPEPMRQTGPRGPPLSRALPAGPPGVHMHTPTHLHTHTPTHLHTYVSPTVPVSTHQSGHCAYAHLHVYMYTCEYASGPVSTHLDTGIPSPPTQNHTSGSVFTAQPPGVRPTKQTDQHASQVSAGGLSVGAAAVVGRRSQRERESVCVCV